MLVQHHKTKKTKAINYKHLDYCFRIGFLILLLAACGVALVVRLVRLGDFKYHQDSQRLQRSQRIVVRQEPQKGLILDTEGRLLAANRHSSTCFVDPVFLLSEPNQVRLEGYFKQFEKIEQVLELPEFTIEDTIFNNPNSRYRPLKFELTKEQIGFVRNTNIRGLGVVDDTSRRHYITGELFSHIIGFAASDKKFSEGLERVYFDELSGIAGYEAYLGDRSRRPINMYDDGLEPVHGISLILTADAVIQMFAREALHRRCQEYQAESGIAIVMNPNTGAIKALVNYPDFDPSNLGEFPIENRRNIAVTDIFEPGSIFKPIVAAAAIDAGVISENTVIHCEYGRYCGRGFGCIGEYGRNSFGNLSIREIIKHSSNIGMAKIGQRMGSEKLYNSLRMLGFGSRISRKEPTELTPEEEKDANIPEFLGERQGLLNRLANWDGYSVTRVPYGQEIGVTALQMVTAYSILANGGKEIQPHIVRAFVDSSGANIIERTPKTGAAYLIDPKVAEFMVKDAMVSVVNEPRGTGSNAALDDFTVWGKTGTANIAVDGVYDNQNFVASFVGGAPAEDPKLVVLVSVIKPNRRLGKGYTGGTVAAPVVGEILEKSLNYLKVPPETEQGS